MISLIGAAIEDADAHGSLSNAEVQSVLTGLSGSKLVGALQRLALLFAEQSDACYAEIGVFQGLTLLSVATAAAPMSCIGIDNFSQFDPQGKNYSIFKRRKQELRAENAQVINDDFEAALLNFAEHSGRKKIGVLFVDGPHDYRSQLICLLFAKELLHEHAVIVVDDSNYQHVRQANHDFLISHPEYKLLFEPYTPQHPIHMTAAEEKHARAGWWDGVNIIVRDHENLLEPILPPTGPQSACFINEHTVHAHRYGPLAPEAMAFLSSLEKPFKLPLSLTRLIRAFRGFEDERKSARLHTNTFSDGLPSHRFATLRL